MKGVPEGSLLLVTEQAQPVLHTAVKVCQCVSL